MKLLEERILRDGIVKPGNVLMVNNFLNHQIDVELLDKIGQEFGRLFADRQIDKILTIEASGIGIACLAARYFNNCPVVFAKKAKTTNLGDTMYLTHVKSYTHGNISDVIIDKRFLNKGEKVLVLDDFLAHGQALHGLCDLIDQAGAELQGIGIVIEKGFQNAGDEMRAAGINLKSLAIVDSMDGETGRIVFRENDD